MTGSQITDIRASAPRAPLWLLALLTFNGTLALHIFVPALPDAATNLRAGPGSMRLTISFYMLGLAIGQLVHGPMSDRFGRRSVLIVGLIIFTAASLAAALGTNVHVLIAIRLVQAFGGSAGLVLGRAIVRDAAVKSDATKRLALMSLMIVIGSGIAPLIGSTLVVALGWRAIFVALAAFGVTNLLLTWRLLAETGGGGAHDRRSVLWTYRHLVGSRAFLGFAVGGGCATTSSYAFIAAAPFIFVDQLHRPETEVGLYLALNVVGLWLGSLAASRIAERIPTTRLLVQGNLLSLVGAAVLLMMASVGYLSVPSIMLPMMLFSFGIGIASPAALSAAMNVNPVVAGSASGLYGFVQMAVGALCTSLAGIGSNPLLSAALVLSTAAVLAQTFFALALRTRGTAIDNT